MRKIFVELYNADFEQPYLLPRYMVITDWKFKVKEIKTCFASDNIKKNGQKWKSNQIIKEYEDWMINHKWLMKNLRKYIRKNFFKLFFNAQKDFEKENAPRFIYVSFLKRW